MSQITPEEMQRRGALLKRAKQILIQEYAAIRTQQHQQWIRDSETSWKINGVLMAYPPGKLYPSEQDIIDKALELYNKSITATALKIEVPEVSISNTPNIQPEPSISETLDSSPLDVTARLQEVYNKASSVPIDNRLIGVTVSDYIETLTQLPIIEKVEEEPVVEEIKEEPIVEEIKEELNLDKLSDTTELPAKHSLLRSVLSGWLSKNKDKET
jgi:hypothetical protein